MNASLIQENLEHLAHVGVEISFDDNGLLLGLYLEEGTHFFRKEVWIGFLVFRRSLFGITQQILHQDRDAADIVLNHLPAAMEQLVVLVFHCGLNHKDSALQPVSMFLMP